MFAYCNNNPVNGADPEGKRPQDGDLTTDEKEFLAFYYYTYHEEYDYEWDKYDDISIVDEGKIAQKREGVIFGCFLGIISIATDGLLDIAAASLEVQSGIGFSEAAISIIGGLVVGNQEIDPRYSVSKTKYYDRSDGVYNYEGRKIESITTTEYYALVDTKLLYLGCRETYSLYWF